MLNPSTSSGRKTAAAQISVHSGIVHNVLITPPTTGVALVTIYDSADGTTAGKLILSELMVEAGNNSVPMALSSPVIANLGIYCTFSGTNSSYVVHYSLF